jgi:hypothetical protein
MHYIVKHIVSFAGIPVSELSTLTLYKDLPGESDLDKLKGLFQSTHGYIPPYFDSKGMNSMVNPLKEGIFYH